MKKINDILSLNQYQSVEYNVNNEGVFLLLQSLGSYY